MKEYTRYAVQEVFQKSFSTYAKILLFQAGIIQIYGILVGIRIIGRESVIGCYKYINIHDNTFCDRINTPLYDLRTDEEKIDMALKMATSEMSIPKIPEIL